MRMRLLLAALPILVGCGNEPSEGGGFETSDLQARVATRSGLPAAGARVWLVRSRGDTAPAVVLDSARTGVDGIVQFPVSLDCRSGLGLDAQGDSGMGFVPGAFDGRDSAALRLGPSGTVSVARDSSGVLPLLFVPGSHFQSAPGPGGTAAVLRIPRGAWTIAAKTPSGVVLHAAIAVDSVPVDLRHPAADSLPAGPRIGLDSFQIGGTGFYDAGSSIPATWAKMDGVVDSFRYQQGAVTDDTGRNAFHIGTDSTSGLRGLAAGVSRKVPRRGSIAVAFDPWDSAVASSATKILSLLDSNGAGMVVSIDSASEFAHDALVLRDSGGIRRQLADTAYPGRDTALRVLVWYLTWNDSTVRIDNSAGWSATWSLPWSTAPIFSIEIRPSRRGWPSQVLHVKEFRLYEP